MISYSYDHNPALKAAEDVLARLGEENLQLRNKIRDMENLRYDKDVVRLRRDIQEIQRYDNSVKKIISESPSLQESWDDFRVQYQMIATQELLDNANSKIRGEHGSNCSNCKQVIFK